MGLVTFSGCKGLWHRLCEFGAFRAQAVTKIIVLYDFQYPLGEFGVKVAQAVRIDTGFCRWSNITL